MKRWRAGGASRASRDDDGFDMTPGNELDHAAPGVGSGSGGSAVPLIAAWVAAQMSGSIAAGDAAREFADVSIDTRTMTPGDLYVGIRGERFDGAAFAATAIDAGAAGVVVPRGWRAAAAGVSGVATDDAKAPGEGGAVVIEVDDTTAALQALAHGIRREAGTKVVAITGSAGKTTTKEVTSEFLESRYRVVRNRGNFNNHIGLPLSLIGLRQRPEMAVVELGMNHAGEISTLVRVAEPEIRVWTNVGEAHLGFFASVDAIADAKAEILEGATESTLLVANADDPRIMARIGAFRGRVVTFGIDRDADVRARDVLERGIEGISAARDRAQRRNRDHHAAGWPRQPGERSRGGRGGRSVRRAAGGNGVAGGTAAPGRAPGRGCPAAERHRHCRRQL